MTGLICGTSLFGSDLLEQAKTKEVKTDKGVVEAKRIKDTWVIPRHGEGIPPHQVNFKANALALKKLEEEKVIGISSCGSLKKEIKPPCFMVPHDYINFLNIQTFFHNEIKHITPELDERLREKIISAAKISKNEVFEKGVLSQTRGPRLETKAEVQLISRFADIVGMTTATEATLVQEQDMRYASLCTVDNFGNSIEGEFTYEQLMQKVEENQGEVEKVFKELMEL